MYIELECFLLNKTLINLDVKQTAEPARLSVDLNSIESFRESMDDETQEISTKECLISLKSGDSYIVNIGYDELKKKL
jgi:hypothetical protein